MVLTTRSIAYLVVAPPMGMSMRRYGYKLGIHIGLGLFIFGAVSTFSPELESTSSRFFRSCSGLLPNSPTIACSSRSHSSQLPVSPKT